MRIVLELQGAKIVHTQTGVARADVDLAHLFSRDARVYLVVDHAATAESAVLFAREGADSVLANGKTLSAATVAPSTATAGLPTRSPDESPVSYVQRLRRERGAVSYKPREWAPVLGLTVDEMKDAIDDGRLASEVKEHGKDHGARLIGADAMLAYLATADAVRRGLIAPRSWRARGASGRKTA